MKTQHTPGPWRYVRENGSPSTGQHMVAGARPGYLAEVRDCGSGCVEANARLIAAAPELLAALVAAVELIETLSPNECDTLRHARAAVAKAVGHNATSSADAEGGRLE